MCFCPGKQCDLKQYANAPVCNVKNAELSGDGLKAALVVPSLVLEVASSETLCSPCNGLPLCQCLRQSVLAILGSHWQDTWFSVLHKTRS